MRLKKRGCTTQQEGGFRFRQRLSRARGALVFLLLLVMTGAFSSAQTVSAGPGDAPGQVAVEGPSRGYTTTPQELRVIAQKAAQGAQPYASAVKDVMSWAGRSWDFSLAANVTCPSSEEPAWLDDGQGIPILYAKAMAYHLTGDARYADEARAILQRIMTEVQTISLEDRQCMLNFGWGTPELVAAADLIENRFKGQTCTGPLNATYGDGARGSGDCKRLFQNWLVKNPYYVVSYSAEAGMSNWGAAATNATAYIADYLIDRSDVTLLHRNPKQINGGRDSAFSPLQAYQHANKTALDRMNGYAVDYLGGTSCDMLDGAQQSVSWSPVKSQITERGIVPEEARRTEYCNIPNYNGLYQNYPQVHLNNLIQQCELMLRRGDTSCFENVDNSDIPNFSYTDRDGHRETTHLRPGRGSVERAINAIIIDSRTDWRHDAALQVAYRYYKGRSRLGGVEQWVPMLSQNNQCSQGVCFGTLTHGFASNEQPGLPPVAPLSPIGGTNPQPTAPAPSATLTASPLPSSTPTLRPTATLTPTLAPTVTTAPTSTPSAAPTNSPPATSTPMPATQVPPQPTGSPSSLIFLPVADAQVKSSRPTGNYGRTTDLRGRLTSSEDIDSYLKFNVSGVSGSVSRALLRLYVIDDSPDGGTLYSVANTYKDSAVTWTESGINWNNAPRILGLPLAGAGAVKAGLWVELDVSAAVRGNGEVSFVLTSNHSNSVLYNAREAVSNQPTLVIQTDSGVPGSTPAPTQPPATPTPIPTTAVPPTLIPPTSTPVTIVTPLPISTAPAGSAPVLTFVPSDDAQVKSSRPTSNYGAQTDLRARFASTEDIDSYLKFNVTGVGGPVARATLRLYVTDGSPDGGSLYAVANSYRDGSGDWTERGIHWNNAPAISGAPLAGAGAVGNGVWAEFDVTAVVRGDGVYSFALTSANSNSVLFSAKEAPVNQPVLVVEVGDAQPRALSAASILPAVLPTDLPATTPAPAIAPVELLVQNPAGERIIESDTAEVTRTAGWVAMSNPPGASGGSFLANTSAAETLTLQFTGTAVEVGYVENQAFGAFVIEVDGQPVQTVGASTEASFVFGRRAVVVGLPDTAHTLRIVPQNSVVAIDFFAVTVPSGESAAVVAPPVDGMVPTPVPAVPATAIPPVISPTVEMPPAEAPQVMPTFTPTPMPVLLPFLPVSAAQFVATGGWQPSAETQWLVSGSEAGTLMIGAPLDLRAATMPVVSFNSWLSAVAASAGVQVSLDGLAWQTLSVITPGSDWQPVIVDLSAYRGQVVWLRWVWLPQPPPEPPVTPDSWQIAAIQVVDAMPTPVVVTPALVPTMEAPVPLAPAAPASPEIPPISLPIPTDNLPAIAPPAELLLTPEAPPAIMPPANAEATAEPPASAEG